MRTKQKLMQRGFTLVELLVVIAIIAILSILMIPAIQACRESARRSNCQSNMTHIVMATHEYEAAHEVYPSGVSDKGGPIRNEAKGLHASWTIRLLPYLDEPAAGRAFDKETSVYDAKHEPLRNYVVESLICPSDITDNTHHSSYAAVHHDVEAPIDAKNNGSFFLNSRLRRDDLSDGAGHTLFFGEKRIEPGDLGWLSGTRATLRNCGWPLNANEKLADTSFDDNYVPAPEYEAGVAPAFPPLSPQDSGPIMGADGRWYVKRKTPLPPSDDKPKSPTGDPSLFVGTFGSRHAAGLVIFAFGDGQVRAIADQADVAVLQKLSNRSDGALVNLDELE